MDEMAQIGENQKPLVPIPTPSFVLREENPEFYRHLYRILVARLKALLRLNFWLKR